MWYCKHKAFPGANKKSLLGKKVLAGAAVVALILVSACSANKTMPYQGDAPEYIYAVGHKALQEGKYNKAIEAYRSLGSQYPFEKYSRKAMLEMIYAYYSKGESSRALAIAKQYIKLYPQSDHVAYAYYMRGVINFNNGRGFLQKYMPYDMSKHDPGNYRKAFYDFKKAVQLAPDAPYAKDARRRMIFLVDIIARYHMNIAHYYYNKGAYVAAISRAEIVISSYPRTREVEDALVLSIKSYQQLELPEQAGHMRKLLKANFPDNAYLKNS